MTSHEAAWTAGEPLAAVLERALREAVAAVHADVAAVNMGLPVSVPVPPLPPVCPGAWTRDASPEWPHGQLRPASWVHGPEQRADLLYAAERALRRAVTDFLDAWERGDVQLIGRRSDGAVEAVPGYLRHSLFLALHPRTGVLLPAVWRGQPPPPDVLRHSYSDLKVLRMELPSAEAPAAPDPSEAPPKPAETVAKKGGGSLTPAMIKIINVYLRDNPKAGYRRVQRHLALKEKFPSREAVKDYLRHKKSSASVPKVRATARPPQ